jgi:hypothetical protein
LIAVKIEGRMGNQMFQYAFAYTTAKQLGVNFYLDKSIEPYLLTKYFNVKKDGFYFLDNYLFTIKGFKNLFSHHLKRICYQSIAKLLSFKQTIVYNELTFAQQQLVLNDRELYSGFFQSEAFFLNAKEDIKQHFQIKEVHQNAFKKIFDELPKEKSIITVHVRRTDYLDANLALPLNYYHKVINEIDFEKSFVIFISDDPDFIAKEFAYVKHKYISKNTAIIDFQFLVHADICILSNSSYSWWGAYLNVKNAKVIAPKFWSGHANQVEEPAGILIKDWILKSVQ